MTVVAVAPAAPYQARALAARLPFKLYLDQQRLVQDALQMDRPGFLAWLTNLRGWRHYLHSFIRNRRQGRITGHHSNLPAVAIIEPDGTISFLHRGTSMGDYPTVAELLDRLDGGNS